MKLLVQIPCLNEEATLPQTVADVPREIPGIDEVRVLVIDDGSTDRTVEVAQQCGVDHILSFTSNKGLATAFAAGLDMCLRLGADIIVHTDADNQYRGDDIPKLIRPILEGKADLVVGCRPIEDMEDFSWLKKRLQRLGSWVVRQVSATNVPDAASGFRAYSREAALRLNVVLDFTYTLETLIQAGRSDLTVAHVPIRANPKTRESRLFHGNLEYVLRSLNTILRIYVLYRPLRAFVTAGALLCLPALALAIRFLYFYLTGSGSGHVQSLMLAAVLMILGFQLGVFGMIADLLAANRKLSQDTLYRLRRLEGVDTEPPVGVAADTRILDRRSQAGATFSAPGQPPVPRHVVSPDTQRDP